MEDWIVIKESKFEVEFPETPYSIVVPIENSEGDPLYMRGYMYEPHSMEDLNSLYSLLYIDYPVGSIHHKDYPLKLKQFLDAMSDRLVEGILDGNLDRTLSTNRPDFVGRMLDVSCYKRQFTHKIHVFLSEHRLYILQCTTLMSHRDNDVLRKFFSSFMTGIRLDNQNKKEGQAQTDMLK